MPDDGSLHPLLLDRFLSGEASPAERDLVNAWLASDSRNDAMLRALRDAFPNSPSAAADTDRSWARLRDRIAAEPVVASQRSDMADLSTYRAVRDHSPNRWLKTTMRVAATVLVAIGLGSAWRLTRNPMHESTAPAGQRVTVTLSDGTRMTLAPGSRAQWRGDYGRTTREVMLTGEAYFDVVHDDAHPFQVHALGGVASDVGTRFVMSAWPEQAGVSVAVEEGAVAFREEANHAALAQDTLRAGDVGTLDSTGRVAISHNADAALAWMHGELVFNDVPLSQALPSLSRWYDAELRADPSLVDRRLTGRFKSQPLPELLDALALALNVRISRTGNAVILLPAAQ